jgi:uncharacterized protein
MEMGPVKPRERLVTLDILRGFALLGVLLGNLAHLYSGFFLAPRPPDGTADFAARTIVTFLIQSKAQTLLTFLFGFGFANQLLRAEERGEPIGGIYTRRILALLGLGILHVCLLWWGDVLWTYAVTAPFLLLFLRTSDRVRMIAAIVLILVPVVVFAIPSVYDGVFSLATTHEALDAHRAALAHAIHGSDHVELLKVQATWAPYWIAGGWPQYFAWLVGNYLLGYVVGRRRWFDHDGADHLPAFRRLFWAGLVVGLGTWVVYVLQLRGVVRPHSTSGHILLELNETIDYVAIALVYGCGLVLLAQRPRVRRVLAVVAPLGRMPLTTYLTQSLVCTFLIYGWGLGWIEWMSELGYLGLGLALFAIQIVVAHVWLRSFRYGPLEWLWRWAVYARRPPFLIARDPEARR